MLLSLDACQPLWLSASVLGVALTLPFSCLLPLWVLLLLRTGLCPWRGHVCRPLIPAPWPGCVLSNIYILDLNGSSAEAILFGYSHEPICYPAQPEPHIRLSYSVGLFLVVARLPSRQTARVFRALHSTALTQDRCSSDSSGLHHLNGTDSAARASHCSGRLSQQHCGATHLPLRAHQPPPSLTFSYLLLAFFDGPLELSTPAPSAPLVPLAALAALASASCAALAAVLASCAALAAALAALATSALRFPASPRPLRPLSAACNRPAALFRRSTHLYVSRHEVECRWAGTIVVRWVGEVQKF